LFGRSARSIRPVERNALIDAHSEMTIMRQCARLGLCRSSWDYQPQPVSQADLRRMRRIDERHLAHPFLGARRLARMLQREGFDVGRRHGGTLMPLMGVEAIDRKRRTSIPAKGHQIYPSLLANVASERSNQAWAADITYLPMAQGVAYLVAILDLYSRKVLSGRVSNAMSTDFCVEALEAALTRYGAPEIFNPDQGSQFTADDFTQPLQAKGVRVSMDGTGRWVDNVFVERLWRSVTYEDLYLHAYETMRELNAALANYFDCYHARRPHQRLDDRTPDAVYFGPDEMKKTA